VEQHQLRINPAKIKTAKRYVELIKSTFGSDLVSVFVFGSVARGEDTSISDIDLTAVLRKPPAASQLRKIGKTGRFGEIIGRGEFRKIPALQYPWIYFWSLSGTERRVKE
jgi:predicted nucleotidyltransferase